MAATINLRMRDGATAAVRLSVDVSDPTTGDPAGRAHHLENLLAGAIAPAMARAARDLLGADLVSIQASTTPAAAGGGE